jgi:hypothetical protein
MIAIEIVVHSVDLGVDINGTVSIKKGVIHLIHIQARVLDSDIP